MKTENKSLLSVLVIILFFNAVALVDAGIEVDEDSSFIEKDYVEGDFVRGQLNMYFSELKNRDFTAEFDNEETEDKITLMELLEKMNYTKGVDFFCEPAGCYNDYEVLGSGYTSRDISISMDKKVFGFLFEHDPAGTGYVKRFKFDIVGKNIGSSCSNQIFIDFLNDGSWNFWNTESLSGLDDTCGRPDAGCFEESKVTGEIGVVHRDDGFQCGKIENLAPAPGYRVIANVKKIESGTGEKGVSLFFYDGDRNILPNGCTVVISTVGVYQQVSCSINYSSKTRISEAFVCINTPDKDIDYKINAESNEPCGGGASSISFWNTN